jgi:hypothetical protein
VVTPVVVGFVLGKEMLGGLLAGVTAGGCADGHLHVQRRRRLGQRQEAHRGRLRRHFGGKGSDAHKAAVVGDTVGDPFKDTAGPSLNILIKLMAVVALVIAPLFTPTSTPTVTPTPTSTATPTPRRCCSCPDTNSCGPPVNTSFVDFCEPGCTSVLNASCNGVDVSCPTHTVTLTPTVTPTGTPTRTPTRTPTVTLTPTDTPVFPEIDPYKCYKAKGVGSLAKERLVTYTDEFETKRTRVMKPFLICNASAPSDSDIPIADVTPPPLHDPAGRLICYKIRDERKIEKQERYEKRTVDLRTRVEVHTESGVCCQTASCDDTGGVDPPCTSCKPESSCSSDAQCAVTETCTHLVDARERYEAIKPFVICVPSVRDFP